MKSKLLTIIMAAAFTSLCSSCIIQQTVQLFILDPYPGDLPPSVVVEVDGKPQSGKWLRNDPDALPTPQALIKDKEVTYAEDGIPYSFTTNFKDVLFSPYAPFNQLSYKGVQAGTKVWDPYTRKPFYIKRTISIN